MMPKGGRPAHPWADLPRRYPPYSTCYRRFQRWVRDSVFERLLRGRKLPRYRRRWLIERLFAWLLRCRRLVTRYEARSRPE
jgi:transposase